MADLEIEIVANIEGLDELEEALTEGSKRTVKKFLRRVEMKAATPLVRSAREYAPYETGRLEGDIHKQTVQGNGSLTVRVGPGKDSFYGLFQEFGAPDANVPALHWMEESAKAVQDEVMQEYMDAVTEGLEDMKR